MREEVWAERMDFVLVRFDLEAVEEEEMKSRVAGTGLVSDVRPED